MKSNLQLFLWITHKQWQLIYDQCLIHLAITTTCTWQAQQFTAQQEPELGLHASLSKLTKQIQLYVLSNAALVNSPVEHFLFIWDVFIATSYVSIWIPVIYWAKMILIPFINYLRHQQLTNHKINKPPATAVLPLRVLQDLSPFHHISLKTYSGFVVARFTCLMKLQSTVYCQGLQVKEAGILKTTNRFNGFSTKLAWKK